MNMQDQDDILARRARELFLESTRSLDPKVLASLSAARRRAVDAVAVPGGFHLSWRVPAGAVALLFVAVVGGALWTGSGQTPPPASSFTAASTDAPLMMTNDNLDMYSDMDFYQWLATQDQPAPAPQNLNDSNDDDDDTGVGG